MVVAWSDQPGLVVQSRAAGSGEENDSDHSDDKAPRNYLTFEIGYVGNARSEKNPGTAMESWTDIEFHDRFTGMIEVRPERTEKGTVNWYPRGDTTLIDGTINEKVTMISRLVGEGEAKATETRATTYAGHPSCEASVVNASVKIRANEKLYDLQFALMPDMATTMDVVRQTKEAKIVGAPSLGGNQPPAPTTTEAVPLDMAPGQLSLGFSNYSIGVDVKGAPLSSGSTLTGTRRIQLPKPAGWQGSWNLAVEVTWKIDVSLPPVELVITAEGYEKWRPLGSIAKPTEPGNHLAARATLRAKVGGMKLLPEVKNIRFQLLDTSREPGVCMNWPLDAKDDDYDLRLAAVAGGTLSKADQILEVTDPRRNDEGQPYAEARIDSYDFGGRASLRAVCLLADGREIEGVMKGEGEMPRLPKMKGPGWIAESWRKDHQAEDLPEDQDDEKVTGQKDNGDGFTLYEEYRGWAENGEHIEGDPAKKDFFILNLFKPATEARAGIALFEQLSQLRVHSKLLPTEMSEEARLMNGNHRDAPRHVEQHGVLLKQFASKADLGDEGADTPMTEKGVAGRPRITKGIGILTRGSTESIFSQAFNLPPQDQSFAYDRAIAHELLHSVGVEHHGSNKDYYVDLFLIVPQHPENHVGKPYFTLSLEGYSPLVVLEESGQDMAADTYGQVSQIIDMAHVNLLGRYIVKAQQDFARDKSYNKKSKYASPEIQADVEFYNDQAAVYAVKHALVGVAQGAHSGNQDCVMRYYFAKFYEGKGGSGKTFYKVTPGSERIGKQLCRSAAGTGVNAPKPPNLPQSRYGNAADDAGNCFEQICPNDAIPPRTVKD